MADTQPYRPRKRGYETAGDMLRSLLPIVILVLVFAAFCVPRGDTPESRIDPSTDIRSAVQNVEFEILAPEGLSDSWIPTSSALLRVGNADGGAPNGVTIGYVTPQEEFARFTIRQGLRSEVLPSAVDGAKISADPSGNPVDLDGRQWTPFTAGTDAGYTSVSGDGEQAIVLVVFGSADSSELLELAGSLAPGTG